VEEGRGMGWEERKRRGTEKGKEGWEKKGEGRGGRGKGGREGAVIDRNENFLFQALGLKLVPVLQIIPRLVAWASLVQYSASWVG